MGGGSGKAFCKAKPLERGVGNYVAAPRQKIYHNFKILPVYD
jgi:hypothetical protein